MIPLRIFNTLTGNKTDVSNSAEFRMFICGPTVQDNVHMGHAKTYLAFDLLARWLLRSGRKVFFLMNITDVDDKIFDRARKESSNYASVADRFYKAFVEDMESLNIITVSKYARVSKHVEDSAALVQELLDSGKAYVLEGNVFFDTSEADRFGKLSHLSPLDLRLKQIDAAPGKRNSVDFLLWRRIPEAKEGIWHTSFGDGRPGWHIEDTAIAFSEFKGAYDLHGGATELIFPHHEAELAQDEAISGKIPFVKIWMHTGLLLKGKEKMSKSLGNVIKIREALKKFSADEIRLHFLKHHYRDSFEIDEHSMTVAQEECKKVVEAAKIAVSINQHRSDSNEVWKEFSAHLDDDLDSPKAMELLIKIAEQIIHTPSRKTELGPVFWDMVETFGFRLV
ncbi:MAG: class I tRNA ligase family protein [Thaumarchaeota archaeon]|nr:class I tRNA ligase family protein [Nitrososphaerota archaeon]